MNSRARQLGAALALMRPAQWPILTGQFLVAALLVSPRAQAGGCWLNGTSLLVLGCGWLTWVILLNGGTLAFNSAFDRDTGPVAYLAAPPLPPAWLDKAAVLAMGLGAVLGWRVIGSAYGLLLGMCLVLSVLYSHPSVRLKGRPGWDLVTNMIGYGAATTLAGIMTGQAAYLGLPQGACPTDAPDLLAFPAVHLPVLSNTASNQLAGALDGGRLWLVLGFGFLFGSFYPNTQVYQAEDDRRRGDRTLTTALGESRAMLLALVLGAAAAIMFSLAWRSGMKPGGATPWAVGLPLIAVTLWLGHQWRWWKSLTQLDAAANEKLMYRSLSLWAVVDVAVLLGWFLR